MDVVLDVPLQCQPDHPRNCDHGRAEEPEGLLLGPNGVQKTQIDLVSDHSGVGLPEDDFALRLPPLFHPRPKIEDCRLVHNVKGRLVAHVPLKPYRRRVVYSKHRVVRVDRLAEPRSLERAAVPDQRAGPEPRLIRAVVPADIVFGQKREELRLELHDPRAAVSLHLKVDERRSVDVLPVIKIEELASSRKVHATPVHHDVYIRTDVLPPVLRQPRIGGPHPRPVPWRDPSRRPAVALVQLAGSPPRSKVHRTNALFQVR
mmetsp:Transcript_251/g.809  ORF Transcript_251/g.809 Transcript_251/m.809 type:complete len:260 (+) Transcript_251:1742-2521(+)